MRLTELYKKLNDKPLIENEKTYGDLSPEEWDDMRDKMGMKTDDEGNRYIDDEHEDSEKIMVKLGGDAKTELKVSNQTDENGYIDISNITLEFKGKKYEGLEFLTDDGYVVDNHDAIKYIVVIAEADDGTIFEVEVEVNRAWPDDDTINDMYVTALGAFVVRIHKDETVAIGDYLQSKGDGTAKKQADDILRASTIAKVTSTEKTITHSDGSYCVPCTLHCG